MATENYMQIEAYQLKEEFWGQGSYACSGSRLDVCGILQETPGKSGQVCHTLPCSELSTGFPYHSG